MPARSPQQPPPPQRPPAGYARSAARSPAAPQPPSVPPSHSPTPRQRGSSAPRPPAQAAPPLVQPPQGILAQHAQRGVCLIVAHGPLPRRCRVCSGRLRRRGEGGPRGAAKGRSPRWPHCRRCCRLPEASGSAHVFRPAPAHARSCCSWALTRLSSCRIRMSDGLHRLLNTPRSSTRFEVSTDTTRFLEQC